MCLKRKANRMYAIAFDLDTDSAERLCGPAWPGSRASRYQRRRDSVRGRDRGQPDGAAERAFQQRAGHWIADRDHRDSPTRKQFEQHHCFRLLESGDLGAANPARRGGGHGYGFGE